MNIELVKNGLNKRSNKEELEKYCKGISGFEAEVIEAIIQDFKELEITDDKRITDIRLKINDLLSNFKWYKLNIDIEGYKQPLIKILGRGKK